MIKLYVFAPAWSVPNPSMFCVKVETFLRMVDLPYETVHTLPNTAPKGKLPYIEDQGKTIADSHFIIEYLKQTYGADPDAALSPVDQAVSHAMQRMIEENTYWVVMYSRWSTPTGWVENRHAFFGGLPPVVRALVATLVRREMRAQIRGQGMGRHSAQEIDHIGMLDLSCLSAFLAEKPYFLGQEPTTLDASAFSLLSNLVGCPIPSPLKQQAQKLANLAAFTERMWRRFFDQESVPSASAFAAPRVSQDS